MSVSISGKDHTAAAANFTVNANRDNPRNVCVELVKDKVRQLPPEIREGIFKFSRITKIERSINVWPDIDFENYVPKEYGLINADMKESQGPLKNPLIYKIEEDYYLSDKKPHNGSGQTLWKLLNFTPTVNGDELRFFQIKRVREKAKEEIESKVLNYLQDNNNPFQTRIEKLKEVFRYTAFPVALDFLENVYLQDLDEWDFETACEKLLAQREVSPSDKVEISRRLIKHPLFGVDTFDAMLSKWLYLDKQELENCFSLNWVTNDAETKKKLFTCCFSKLLSELGECVDYNSSIRISENLEYLVSLGKNEGYFTHQFFDYIKNQKQFINMEEKVFETFNRHNILDQMKDEHLTSFILYFACSLPTKRPNCSEFLCLQKTKDFFNHPRIIKFLKTKENFLSIMGSLRLNFLAACIQSGKIEEAMGFLELEFSINFPNEVELLISSAIQAESKSLLEKLLSKPQVVDIMKRNPKQFESILKFESGPDFVAEAIKNSGI